MSIWTTDIDSVGCKSRPEFSEQPVVRSETSNEENWLDLISFFL